MPRPAISRCGSRARATSCDLALRLASSRLRPASSRLRPRISRLRPPISRRVLRSCAASVLLAPASCDLAPRSPLSRRVRRSRTRARRSRARSLERSPSSFHRAARPPISHHVLSPRATSPRAASVVARRPPSSSTPQATSARLSRRRFASDRAPRSRATSADLAPRRRLPPIVARSPHQPPARGGVAFVEPAPRGQSSPPATSPRATSGQSCFSYTRYRFSMRPPISRMPALMAALSSSVQPSSPLFIPRR